MDVEKQSLPRGLSYPLKSSMLANALETADIKIATHLVYYRSGLGTHAQFWPPNENVPYERLYITVTPTRSEESFEARKSMQETGIPELISWIKGILALPPSSPIRREKQIFVVR